MNQEYPDLTRRMSRAMMIAVMDFIIIVTILTVTIG
jgi:hypothetical protein